MTEISNGVYDTDTVTANYVQFWFHGFRSVVLWKISVPVFLLRGPPFHFPKGHNRKAPTGRQPLSELCSAAPCNSGLGNFACLVCLPRPEGQNLNLIKLQPYQEWRDGKKADESQMNGLDFTVKLLPR
ncbi:hypothetical protein TNCV_2477081 [Trichonephila clavipes]|nr:hypothetical protein TNCV_2477081 [Trichonephila clavipes]